MVDQGVNVVYMVRIPTIPRIIAEINFVGMRLTATEVQIQGFRLFHLCVDGGFSKLQSHILDWLL